MKQEEFGKIKRVEYGMGGYQDVMFGFTFSLGGKSWGVSDFWGFWSNSPDSHTRWTKEEQEQAFLDSSLKVLDLLKRSGRTSISDLVGVPIKCYFENNTLKSWNIIEDAC